MAKSSIRKRSQPNRTTWKQIIRRSPTLGTSGWRRVRAGRKTVRGICSSASAKPQAASKRASHCPGGVHRCVSSRIFNLLRPKSRLVEKYSEVLCSSGVTATFPKTPIERNYFARHNWLPDNGLSMPIYSGSFGGEAKKTPLHR